jgi:calcineurin-like phosphoesterase family protein
MKTWITSDHHFRHANIIKYTNRPYADVMEMDDELVSVWNNFVDPQDTVWHLGDFTLGGKELAAYYFGRLNGHINILGNPWHHDSRWINGMTGATGFSSKSGWMPYLFSPIVVLEEVDTNEDGDSIPAVLCHYQLLNWDRQHYGSLHFFGHSHGVSAPRHNCLDVGVDNAFKLTGDYRPFEFQEAVEIAQSLTSPS